MRLPRCSSLLCAAAALVCSLGALDITAADDSQNRIFELRTYTTHPGKLAALHSRFRDHTNRIFKKHGIQMVGYWTPTEGAAAENTLIYLLAFPNREARDKAWERFRNDPEWKQVAEQSQQDGRLVKKVETQFLAPTDYSPIK